MEKENLNGNEHERELRELVFFLESIEFSQDSMTGADSVNQLYSEMVSLSIAKLRTFDFIV